MAKTYTITFKDLKSRDVVITLNDETLETGDTVALTPAESPFITTEDDDYDPMIPLRSTTARISVVCTCDDIIKVENNRQWSVTVTRGGVVVWRGFLRTEMGDMDYCDAPSTITYIADDILGSLKSIRKTLGSSKTSLANLLAFSYTLIDNSVPVISRGGDPNATLSTLSAMPWNWVSQEENDEGIMENVNDMSDVPESDIAQFLGVTLRYYNNKYYMGSLFATKFFDNGTQLSLPALDGSAFTWTGFCTLKWEEGIGLVKVQSEGRAIESSGMPAADDNNIKATSYGYVEPQTSRNTTLNGYNCFARYLEPVSGHGITVATLGIGNPGNIWSKIGVSVVDVDLWTNDGSDKYDFSFSRNFIFVGTGISKSGASISMPVYTYSDTSQSVAYNASLANMLAHTNTPLLVMSSIAPIFADGGGITIDFDYEAAVFEVITSSANSYRRVTSWGNAIDFATLSSRAVCSLQFGDYYWNGTAWQTTSCTFALYMNSAQNPLIKTLEMMFEGQKYAMPISGTMSGALTFTFYGSYWYQETSEVVDDRTVYTCAWYPDDLIRFSTLDIKYNPPIDILNAEEDALVLTQRTDSLPEDNAKEVKLALASSAMPVRTWGWVYNGNNVIDTLHWPKLREDWAPERFVLKRNELALSRLRRLATLTIECEVDDLPFRRITLDDSTWYPMAIKTDWQTNRSEVMVADITDIMAALPAVGTDEESTGGDFDIYVTASGQTVTLTMDVLMDVDVTVEWSTSNDNGTVIIEAGASSVSFDAGETIQDSRDIGFSASDENGDTFNFIYNL